MLRDHNLYEQSKPTCSLGPCHMNIVFLGANSNLIACHGPWFCDRPPSNLMGLTQYSTDHETLSTWCHVGRHAYPCSFEFLWSFKLSCVVTSELDCLRFLDQSHINLYITGQGPSNSSEKWPLVWVTNDIDMSDSVTNLD